MLSFCFKHAVSYLHRLQYQVVPISITLFNNCRTIFWQLISPLFLDIRSPSSEVITSYLSDLGFSLPAPFPTFIIYLALVAFLFPTPLARLWLISSQLLAPFLLSFPPFEDHYPGKFPNLGGADWIEGRFTAQRPRPLQNISSSLQIAMSRLQQSLLLQYHGIHAMFSVHNTGLIVRNVKMF